MQSIHNMTPEQQLKYAKSLIGKNFVKKKYWHGRPTYKQVTKCRVQRYPNSDGGVNHVVQVRVQSVRTIDNKLFGQGSYWALSHLIRECDEVKTI